MNTTEHLLVCLAEECAEIQQATTKALRFGLSDGYPGKDVTNADDIMREIIDLTAVLDLCMDIGILEFPEEAEAMFDAKKQRVNEYMAYAKERKTLAD